MIMSGLVIGGVVVALGFPLAQENVAETAASLDLPARYANYAMSRGTLTSAEDNATKIYAELDR